MLDAGDRLGVYEIVALIGVGGMGEVYRARDTKLGRDVAIKVLPEELARERERLDRFEREAKLLAALNHTNIATLYGFEESGTQQFLVMELVEGETLAERIARGPIPIDEALPLFIQIAEGLYAAHEKGIIHRDLKPSNIKITPEGQIKILDFGLAKAFASKDDVLAEASQSPTLTKGTALGVIMGTAAYMSPEQARGKSVDKRTDIWAFGCCLYEALTGRKVFDGETVADVIGAVVHKEPRWDVLPSNTPGRARILLDRCLRKDARRRLHDIADACLELDEPEQDEAVKAESATARWRWPVLMAVGLACVLIGTQLGQSPVSIETTHLLFDIAPARQIGDLGVSVSQTPRPQLSRTSIALSPDGRDVVFSGWEDDESSSCSIGDSTNRRPALFAGPKARCARSSHPTGRGWVSGAGEVYKAHDTRLERVVAIKVLPEHLAVSSERRERFEREAKAISQLNHPNICTLYDVGHQDGVDFLVMEYIDGETLADRLTKGPLPLDQALAYGIQITDGLDKAHRAGIVHRDLKPGNMMLTKLGVKLLDFGLAKPIENETAGDGSDAPTRQKGLTQDRAIVGTPQYMAPEQVEGKSVDARTDIFAFGAVIFEMLTGRKAFDGDSQASLVAAILTSEPPTVSALRSSLPSSLDRTVAKCLAKDPDERWQTARDLWDELSWIASGASVETTMDKDKPRRSAMVAVVVGVLAGMFAAGVAVWNTMSAPAPRPSLHFRESVPEGLEIRTMYSPPLVFSPDGDQLVLISGLALENHQLHLRSLDGFDWRELPETRGADMPFFSPDGQ